MSGPMGAPARSAETWTPKQREVMDLLARGYTNPQIAEQIGISLDGAKWHVSEIISKLGVGSREEAAAYWVRENRLTVRFGRRFRALVGPLAGVRWAAVAAGTSLAGVALIVGTLAFVVLAGRADDESSAVATTSPTPTSTPAFPAQLEDTIRAIEAKVVVRDWEALTQHLFLHDLKCPDDPEEAQSLVLCAGQDPGAIVRGVSVAASVLHIAGFATPEGVLRFLDSNVPSAQEEEDDTFGSGALELYSVGRTQVENREGAILLFSELAEPAGAFSEPDGPTRWTLQLHLWQDGRGTWGITHLTARSLQLDSHLEPALFEPVVQIGNVEWRRWEP